MSPSCVDQREYAAMFLSVYRDGLRVNDFGALEPRLCRLPFIDGVVHTARNAHHFAARGSSTRARSALTRTTARIQYP